MSVVITYTCDRCGHTQNNSDQMWRTGVFIGHINYPVGEQNAAIWCRKCIESVGLLPPNPPLVTEATQPKKPTLEELIRELIREELPQ